MLGGDNNLIRVKLFLIGAVLLASLSDLSAQTSTSDPPRVAGTPALDIELQLQSFDEVWQRIRDTHWDPQQVGAAWEQARQELRPKIEQTSSIEEVRLVLNDLINRLGQSHFGIIPQDTYGIMEGKGGPKDHDAGIRIRSYQDSLLVAQIRPGSPAAEAGIRPGWRIEKIGDLDSRELSKQLQKLVHGPMRYETLVGLVGERLTAGGKGDCISIDFLDQQGQSHRAELVLQRSPGKFTSFGNLPPMRVHQIARTLDGQIGYFWFNAFLDPVQVMPAYNRTVRNPEHSQGLIIDLRGNRGGIAGMTMGMASQFATESSPLGVMTMKGNQMKFALNARPKPVRVPVAILVDECSISSAEIFAGGMQDLGLARIFGNRTAGLALPSVVTKLPNGDRFQYAIADYHSASGKSLEANGVMPDEPIALTPKLLESQNDPVLERAIQWIQQQTPQTEAK
jgi:carboxyl-terminal processing protease